MRIFIDGNEIKLAKGDRVNLPKDRAGEIAACIVTRKNGDREEHVASDCRITMKADKAAAKPKADAGD